MSLNVNSGRITADISGNVTSVPSFGTPGAAQTIVQKTNSKNGTSITAGTGALLYTVTAGKTLYITHLAVSGSSATAMEIRDGTTIAGTLVTNGSIAAVNPVTIFTFPTPIKFTAGVFIDVADTNIVRWNFAGFEE